MNVARLCVLAAVLASMAHPDAMSVAIVFSVTTFGGDFLLSVYLRRFRHLDESQQRAVDLSAALRVVPEEGQL